MLVATGSRLECAPQAAAIHARMVRRTSGWLDSTTCRDDRTPADREVRPRQWQLGVRRADAERPQRPPGVRRRRGERRADPQPDHGKDGVERHGHPEHRRPGEPEVRLAHPNEEAHVNSRSVSVVYDYGFNSNPAGHDYLIRSWDTARNSSSRSLTSPRARHRSLEDRQGVRDYGDAAQQLRTRLRAARSSGARTRGGGRRSPACSIPALVSRAIAA